MKKAVLGLIVSLSMYQVTYADTNVLVCNDETSSISIYDLAEGEFDHSDPRYAVGAEVEEYLEEITSKLQSHSKELALLYFNAFQKLRSNILYVNYDLGNPSDAGRVYRTCKNDLNLPVISKASSMGANLVIDQAIAKKLDNLNLAALISHEVIYTLMVRPYKEMYGYRPSRKLMISQNEVRRFNSLLFSDVTVETNLEFKGLLESVINIAVTKPILDGAEDLKRRYALARTHEQAMEVIRNTEFDLGYGVLVKLDISLEDVGPHQLANMELRGKPYSLVAFLAVPGSMVAGAAANVFEVVFLTTSGVLAPPLALTIAVAGAAVGTYAAVANTIYMRKLNLIKQARRYLKLPSKKKNGLLIRSYKLFRVTNKEVSLQDYAQRVVDLAYENAFAKQSKDLQKYVSALKMRQIISNSFKN